MPMAGSCSTATLDLLQARSVFLHDHSNEPKILPATTVPPLELAAIQTTVTYIASSRISWNR